MNSILSIQVGRPAKVDASDGKPFRTSLYKQPVQGEIRLQAENLEGNYQADLRYHGGPDKAVCWFPSEHYAAAAEFLGQPLPPGAFGENFTTAGMLEANVCLGDQYQAGSAIVEISQPRQPCNNLVRRWQSIRLPRWMVEHDCTGWYSRVIHPGAVAAGVELELISRPHPDWTIAALNDLMFNDQKNAGRLRSALAMPQLAGSWRESFEKKLKQAAR